MSPAPPETQWPSQLTRLLPPTASYFINDKDQVRSIQDPKYYFHYFISKNERWNDCQRFAMNSTHLPFPLPSPS